MEIVIEELDYIYHPQTPFETQALHQVSMRIPAGTFASILGPTGSGKSTLMQIIGGLLVPTSGRVQIGDQVIENGKKTSFVRGEIGLIFQYPEKQLFAESIGKDIAFGPTNQGLVNKKVEERVKEAMAFVGIPAEWYHRSPFTLSGGQMRKVAIAGVLAMKPKILILDEPTAGLDPQSQRELMQLIAKIHHQQQMTILLVTHQMDIAAKYAEHIFLMSQGTCIAEGSPDEIFSQPELLFQIDLDLPEVTKIILELNQKLTPPIPTNLFSIEQLVFALNNRRKKGVLL